MGRTGFSALNARPRHTPNSSEPCSFFALYEAGTELLQHILRISDMNRDSLGSTARAVHTSPLTFQHVDIFEQPDVFEQPDIFEQLEPLEQLEEIQVPQYESSDGSIPYAEEVAGRTSAAAAAAAVGHRNPHLAATSDDHAAWQWLQVCSCCPVLMLSPNPPPPPPPRHPLPAPLARGSALSLLFVKEEFELPTRRMDSWT